MTDLTHGPVTAPPAPADGLEVQPVSNPYELEVVAWRWETRIPHVGDGNRWGWPFASHPSTPPASIQPEPLVLKSAADAQAAEQRAEIERLRGLLEEAREGLNNCSHALQRLHTDIEALMADSTGVAGLHQNGEVATWEELGEGGRFSDWLGEPLWAARNAWSDARTILTKIGEPR